MGFICGLCFLIGAVILYELFATGVALLVFHWLEHKEQKRKKKKSKERKK